MPNLVQNPFFSDEMVDATGKKIRYRLYVDPETGEVFDNIHVPIQWRMDMVNGVAFDGIEAGKVAERPESILLNMYSFPGDPDNLFNETSYIAKIFRPAPLKFWLEQDIAVEPGARYRFRLLIRPDIVEGYENGEKVFATDEWAAWIVLSADNQSSEAFHNMDYTQYQWLEWEFTAEDNEVTISIDITAKYAMSGGNNFFVDEVWIEEIGDTPPTPPPPASGEVELGPQTRAVLKDGFEYLGDRIAEAIETLSFSPGVPTPPEEPVDVVPLSQRDPRWAGDRLGNSSYTIGSAGCAMVSACMEATLVQPDLQPDELNSWLTNNGGYTPGGLLYWAKVAQYVGGMEFVSYHKWTNSPADLNLVAQELAQGPAILQVDFRPATSPLDSHFVLALRFNANRTDIEIIDPWDGKRKWLLQSYAQDQWDLARAIYALTRYSVDNVPPIPPEPPTPVVTRLGVNDWPPDGQPQSAVHFLYNNGLYDSAIVQPIYLGTQAQARDFSVFADAGIDVYVNLRYSWSTDKGGGGTLPLPNTPAWYLFVEAAAQTIIASEGVHAWTIGNEYNNPREDPADGMLTPQYVVQTYNAIRARVWESTARPLMGVGALDPFNAQKGDPRDWLSEIYGAITGAEIVPAHGYIRGPDPDLVGSPAKFRDAPLQWQYLNYPGCVTELLKYLPERYRSLPVIVTEFNHLWKDGGEGDWGWVDDGRVAEIVRRAYQAGQEANLQVVAFYRWAGDEWAIYNNGQVKDAIREVIS